ncbi:hypothetical protein EGI11_03465 [Chryseobacterium sp. H3056]|uniref:Uncharacterized protein n=1 Tax=Kaistella daneshvariae TaxID=2487074 RepID=A0A3N0WXM2_9FLAO|nr:hypothetical protein [Kaistella daneshvariae]ROI09827.1 hypothetical protein EGI11_03465 [Kaistella daneshvariae]
MSNKYSKESLEKLVIIIEEIAKDPKNAWFKDNLIDLLISDSDSVETLSQKMSKIETHLSLDGIIVLDYKGIDDEKTLRQLTADNIQMQKYRLGKFDNKIDFAEYCRYAHYQAEELINYFFNKKFSSVEESKSFFELNNLPFNEEWKAFERITYYYKMKALTGKIKLIKDAMNLKDGINLNDILYKINEIRNEMSHRSSLVIAKSDENILEEIEERQINLKDWNNYNKSSEEYSLYNKGKSIVFKREQDFEKINKAIYQLKTMVIHLVKKAN